MIKKAEIFFVACEKCGRVFYAGFTETDATEFEDLLRKRHKGVYCLETKCSGLPREEQKAWLSIDYNFIRGITDPDPTPEEVRRNDEYLAKLMEEDADLFPDFGKMVKLITKDKL